MNKKYIILRSESQQTPTSENLGSPFFGTSSISMPDMEVSVSDLSPAEKTDLRRDPRTLAMAEPMPMKLIAPVKSEEVTSSAGGSTWGVEAVRADLSPFTGEGVTVAVLDTGIDASHPAFQGHTLVQKNFTNDVDHDTEGHGTHCAGTIFGKDVDGLRIGIARDVDRALIGKVLTRNGGGTKEIAEAIQWAVNEGANIISMSLGIDFPGYVKRLVDSGIEVQPATSLALEAYRNNVNLFSALAQYVRAVSPFAQGGLLVAASGNESLRDTYEIAVGPPAAGTDVVSVGALSQGIDGYNIAYFSNTQVDLSGPGVGVISAWPGGGLRSLNGTSMATPHVAGVAALWGSRMIKLNGILSGEALRSRVTGTATRVGLAAGLDWEDIGSGLVQAPIN